LEERRFVGKNEYCHFMNANMEAREFFNFVNTGLKERESGNL